MIDRYTVATDCPDSLSAQTRQLQELPFWSHRGILLWLILFDIPGLPWLRKGFRPYVTRDNKPLAPHPLLKNPIFLYILSFTDVSAVPVCTLSNKHTNILIGNLSDVFLKRLMPCNICADCVVSNVVKTALRRFLTEKVGLQITFWAIVHILNFKFNLFYIIFFVIVS